MSVLQEQPPFPAAMPGTRDALAPLPEHFAELFPGFGFFGPTATSGVSIRINASIGGIRLVVRARQAEFLNITGLVVRDATDKPIEFTRENCKARFSSVFENDGARFGPGMFFSRKRGELHTQKEQEPWLELVFAEPAWVKELCILNRGDTWGQRNRHLCAEVLVDGGWMPVWRNGSSACAEELLRIARRWVGERVLEARAEELSGAEARDLVGRALQDAADSPLLERLVTSGARQLMAFLDFYGETPADEREIRLLGAFLAHFVRKDGVMRNFSFIQRLVPDERRMRALQDAVNYYGERLTGGKRSIFTRHGLRGAVLLEKRDAYLELMRDVIDAVSELGVPCSLLYGSLLGAVREQGFIAHDDDVDLCFFVDASSFEEVAREVERVSVHLVAKGFKVVKNPTLNRHIIGSTPRIAVDLFPGWVSDGRLNLYMERMGIRDIDAGIVLPLSSLELYGHSFPAPARPERFLEERYGSGWSVADPFFEWPYPLARS